MRAARVAAGVGFLCVSYAIVRAVLLLGPEWGPALTAVDLLVFTAGAVVLLCSGFYAQGWHNRGAHEDRLRRRRQERDAVVVASMAPAAGRLDASLPTPAGSNDDTLRLPRVVPGEPPPGPGPYTLCLAGPDAARTLNEGGVGCVWCHHARPVGLAARQAWQGVGGHIAICPCCIGRRVA